MAKAKQTPEPHFDGLQYVYTDSSGNNYFEYIHPASMPYKRFVEMQIAEKCIRLGMSMQGFQDVAKVLEQMSIDEKKTQEQFRIDCITIAANIKGRLGYIATKQEYKKYASLFYLIEGEPAVPSDQWHLKKWDIWQNDEKATDFFLHGAFTKLHNLVSTSIQDMMLSFRAAEAREQNLPPLPSK